MLLAMPLLAWGDGLNGDGVHTIPAAAWTGYMVGTPGAARYNRAYGSFVIPRVAHCGKTTSVVVEWAGIGGSSAAYSLPQAGAGEGCEHGHSKYWAWYEWYDGGLKNGAIELKSFRVLPGQRFTVDVDQAGVTPTAFTASFTTADARTGRIIAQSPPIVLPRGRGHHPVGNTAECVAESPAFRNGYLPLPSFGGVTFSACFADASVGNNQIDAIDVPSGGALMGSDTPAVSRPTMTNGRTMLTQPHPVGSPGQTAFTVYYAAHPYITTKCDVHALAAATLSEDKALRPSQEEIVAHACIGKYAAVMGFHHDSVNSWQYEEAYQLIGRTWHYIGGADILVPPYLFGIPASTVSRLNQSLVRQGFRERVPF
jgi:hypothetical protein